MVVISNRLLPVRHAPSAESAKPEVMLNAAALIVGQGMRGIGTTSSNSKLNSHWSGLLQSPGIWLVVISNRLLPVRHDCVSPVKLAPDAKPVTTLNVAALIVGHGVRGIGTTISRSMSNSQRPGLLQSPGVWLVVILKTFCLLSTHSESANPLPTEKLLRLMTGHGGRGIGIASSSSTSKRH